MKISLLDIDRMIEVNKLAEITSGGLRSNKLTYDPNGILSTEIFGISKSERRGTFAYVDLKRPYIHPHIYTNVLKRIWRDVVYIVSGQKKFKIIDGLPKQDPDGWTGLAGLYEHWDEIDWSKHQSKTERSLKLLRTTPRDRIFITKILVCPPAYRDMMLSGTTDSSDHISELNNIYTNIIRQVSRLESGGFLARLQFSSQYKIQKNLAELNEYFQGMISKKKGIIRKYLLGKTVDFGTRSVISAPSYNNERIGDLMIDLDHTAMPLSQCCSTFYPFIESWMMNFFKREIINNPQLSTCIDPATGKEISAVIEDADVQFSERVIRKMIQNYVFNPNYRYKVIAADAVVPAENDRKLKVVLTLRGKILAENDVETTLNRALTVTDLLYLAAVDSCEKRHCMVTRYPVGVDKGIFFNKIRVQSTIEHIRVVFNGREYPYYPKIDLSLPKHKVGVQYVDTLVFSNSMLDGMGGDYDGDQVSVRGIWSDEANIEADKLMKIKMTALNIAGNNSRVVAKEIFNSYYELTKIPKEPAGKVIDKKLQDEYLSLEPDDFTRTYIAKMLAFLSSAPDKNNTKRTKPRHQTWDTIDVPADYFYTGHKAMTMTIGRFLFNKYVLYGSNVISHLGVVDELIHKDGLSEVDRNVGLLLLNDKINRVQFNTYVDRRDCLGFWLNAMLAYTISYRMLKPIKEVEKKKAEMLKQYEKEIAAGDIVVMTKLTKELTAYAKELLKDDEGMDLYHSGDLNFENNYRSNSILKGAVANKITNSYDFINTSFMNGIELEDLPIHANSILSGAYPSAVATKKAGYMGKQILALLQMVELGDRGSDCGSKHLIPAAVTKKNVDTFIYSYMMEGGQMKLLNEHTVRDYIGKIIYIRSPMACLDDKYCNMCVGELFHKLEIEHAGLYAVQLSYSALNLGLKAKHDQSIDIYEYEPEMMFTQLVD